jgi:hypothetical protein
MSPSLTHCTDRRQRGASNGTGSVRSSPIRRMTNRPRFAIDVEMVERPDRQPLHSAGLGADNTFGNG